MAVGFDAVDQALSVATPFQLQAILDNAASGQMQEAIIQLIFSKAISLFSSLTPLFSQFFWKKFNSETITILKIAMHDHLMNLD